eukprot:COSAG01_NODE_52105_length_349_cov_0.756000_1_plen_89_part_10
MSVEAVAAPQLRLAFDHQPRSKGGTVSPPVTPPISSRDDGDISDKLPKPASPTAAEMRRRRAEKRAAKASMGFDVDMRKADASYDTKLG